MHRFLGLRKQRRIRKGSETDNQKSVLLILKSFAKKQDFGTTDRHGSTRISAELAHLCRLGVTGDQVLSAFIRVYPWFLFLDSDSDSVGSGQARAR